MNRKILAFVVAAFGSLFTLLVNSALAQGTAFTYQGRLHDGANSATGSYDLTFAVFTDSRGVNQAGGTLTNTATGITNGLFTVVLDFGPGIFAGAPLWLQIGVETNGGSGFTALAPLQQLTPAPYAIYSTSAGSAVSANSVTAGSVTGAGIAGNSVVKSLNNLQDAVTLAPGANVTITPSGNTLTIASSGGGGGAWSLFGNSGTSPSGGNFLGTTDNQPLEIHVNGMRGMRVEPTAIDANHSGLVNVVNGASVNSATPGVYGATISGGGAVAYNTFGNLINSVTADFGTVGGGAANTSQGFATTVSGGFQNGSYAEGATVGGGENNRSTFNGATVGGGNLNQATGQDSTIAGGALNLATVPGAFVGGGGLDGNSYSGNTASGNASTIAGGFGNVADNIYATVGGGVSNTASGPGAFIGGGGFDGDIGFYANTASGGASTIGGGLDNAAGGLHATVGGGSGNSIAYGADNATVGGGSGNGITANGSGATVGGGQANSCSGENATIPGGFFNQATGLYSFAAGQQAKAFNQGAFVWADSQAATFSSTANDQFCIRAQGGVQLNPATSLFCGSQTRQMLNLWSTNYGTGVQTDDMYFRTAGEYWWYQSGSHNDGFGNAGGGTMLMRLGATGNLIIAGNLTQNSDRNVKSGFQPVDARLVLEKIAVMPVIRWHYTNNAATPHIGPMAQDFYAAFGLGEDDKHITTVDEGGVALAAIQGLNLKLQEESKAKDAQIEQLKQSVAELKAVVSQLAQMKAR